MRIFSLVQKNNILIEKKSVNIQQLDAISLWGFIRLYSGVIYLKTLIYVSEY